MKQKAVYPVKIGYGDGSGKEENVITDANDNSLIRGWGASGCGGIQIKQNAINLVRILNKYKPSMWVEVWG